MALLGSPVSLADGIHTYKLQEAATVNKEKHKTKKKAKGL